MTTLSSSPLRAGLLAAAALAAVTLAGCKTDRIVADSYPENYRQRHPIVLAEGPTRLDLPVGAGRRGLSDRQREDLRAFAADWRKNGRGPIGMMVPSGGDYATPAIRNTLAAAGVPTTAIISQRYGGGAGDVALVKLGYVKLKADVPHDCGLWPQDLGYGGDAYGQTENREYWNFGCSTQKNVAAQVADPEDLARPRTESPIYAARRQAIIEKHRDGGDTTTQYKQEDAVVSDVGGSSK